jgi:hypothetical protein
VQIKQACENMQIFYGAFSDSAFDVALQPIISRLTTEDTLWEDYDDAFVIYRLSLMLQAYGMVLKSEVRCTIFPTVDLSTPAGCALLLRCYAEQFMVDLETCINGNTKCPHYKFYQLGAIYASFKYRAAATPKRPRPKDLKDREGGESKEGDEKEGDTKRNKQPRGEMPCYRHTGFLMDVHDGKDAVPRCTAVKCAYKHKTLRQTTGKEAAIMGKAFMKDKVYAANFKAAWHRQWPLQPDAGAKEEPK